jgi:hypothetical protein
MNPVEVRAAIGFLYRTGPGERNEGHAITVAIEQPHRPV